MTMRSISSNRTKPQVSVLKTTPAKVSSVNETPFPAHMHRYSNQNMNGHCSSQQRLVHGVYGDSETDSDDGYFDIAPRVTPKDTSKNPLAIKLDQSFGPRRHNHAFEIIDTAQISGTRDGNDSQSPEGASLVKLNLSWDCAEGCTSKAEKDVQIFESFDALQNLTTGPRSPRVDAFSFPEPRTASRDDSMLGPHFCATEDTIQPTEADRESLPSARVSDTARQTRVHEFRGTISRFMPPGRIIYFGLDSDSFRRGFIPSPITNLVKRAARSVAKVFRRQNLGIGFAYTRNPDLKVFDIHYDRTLSRHVLAQAFFPDQPRKDRQLRIGPGLVDTGSNDYLYYIENVLAHEFAHILGLRHWDAGFNELSVPSVLWTGTVELSRESIMNTGVHPRQVRFSVEDFRVIREIYSAANGDVRAGKRISNVDPVVS